MSEIVHILKYGKTLCEFMSHTVPKNWPEGHIWVGTDEMSLATCRTCLKQIEAKEEKEGEFYRAITPQILLAVLIFLVTWIFFRYLPAEQSSQSQAPMSVKFWFALALSIWFGLRYERRGKDKEWVIQFAWLPRYVGKKEVNGWPRFVWFSLYERLVVSHKGNYHVERQPFGNSTREGDDWFSPATHEKTHIL